MEVTVKSVFVAAVIYPTLSIYHVIDTVCSVHENDSANELLVIKLMIKRNASHRGPP